VASVTWTVLPLTCHVPISPSAGIASTTPSSSVSSSWANASRTYSTPPTANVPSTTLDATAPASISRFSRKTCMSSLSIC
jgi:hypothetical protein